MAPKKLTIDRIETDERYAAAEAVLRVLKGALAEVQRDMDSIRIERHLSILPTDPNARELRERLKTNRSAVKQGTDATATSDAPAAVTAALEQLKAGPSAPPRHTSETRLATLEDHANVYGAGILAQAEVVAEIRSARSASLADRVLPDHRELVRAQFRKLQAAAAASDDLRDLRSSILASGAEFFGDRLPEPVLRSMLILGSERDWDSEISRTRRLLEDLKIL